MNRRNTKRSDERHHDVRENRQVRNGNLETEAASPSETPSLSASRNEPWREEISRLSKEQRKLQGAFERERAEHAQLVARYSASESHYAQLMRFYVATQRLLDAQSREDLFEIIHEIVASLVGCEEFGIFRLDEHCTLSLVSSCGIDRENLQRIPLGSSLIGTIALKGEPYFGGEVSPGFRFPQESNLTACIPLKRHEELFGAIGIFRLLPQKPGLEADDQELLCLVGRLAALVLLCRSVFCHAVTIGAKT